MYVSQIITNTTSWFKAALDQAESIFGTRDLTWTYIGLEFRDGGPCIWYYANKKISIILSNSTVDNELQFIFQLSHEVCHLLYPTGKNDANNLNEGISTYFSRIFQEKHFPNSNYAIEAISKSAYFKSYDIVNTILENDPNFVIKLRQINNDISNVTFSQIKQANPGLSDEVVSYLIEKFNK